MDDPLEECHSLSGLDRVEQDRLIGYLRGPGRLIALVEVESSAQASNLLRDAQAICGQPSRHVNLPILHAPAGPETPPPFGWLETLHAEGVAFLEATDSVTDTSCLAHTWTWLNIQRELWRSEQGKVLFLLTPAHTDAMARHAPDLWDWVSLKFDLRNRPASDHT